MEKDRGYWEEVIKSKLYDFEEKTIPNEWGKITGKLPGGNRVLFYFRKYGYAVAAAVAALFVAGSLYFYSRNNVVSEKTAVVEKPATNVENPVDKIISRVENTDGNVDNPVENLVDNSLMASVKPVQKQLPESLKAENITEKTMVQAERLSVQTKFLNLEQVQKKSQKLLQSGLLNTRSIENRRQKTRIDKTSLIASASSDVKHRRWSFGMGGGGAGISTASGGGTSADLYSSPVSESDEYMLNKKYKSLKTYAQNRQSTNRNTDAIMTDTYEIPSSAKMEHKTPISVGLGVGYNLNERWSLQSGLVYTLLRSELEYSQTPESFITWKQNLHYVGIPLSVSYKIAEWNKFLVYASAGGMCELNVSGKLKKTIESEGLEKIENENLRMKKPLFSINTRAGITYPLWRFINVYAEAGTSYYFDNKSNIETIRSENPFDVSLQAGIRFGF